MFLRRLLLLLCVCVFGGLWGQAVRAEDLPCGPRVVVQTLPFASSERSDLGIREVTRLNKGSNHALTRDGHGLGSTVVRYVVNAHFATDASGCPSMRVEVGYSNVTVYIARELASDACAFEHVRTHEMTHVQIARRWLNTVPALIERDLRARFSSLQRLPTAERMQAVLASSLANLRHVQGEQDAFDSPSEYRTNDTACRGAIRDTLLRLENAGQI